MKMSSVKNKPKKPPAVVTWNCWYPVTVTMMLEMTPRARHSMAVKKDVPHLNWFLALLTKKMAIVQMARAPAGRVWVR